MSDSTTAPAPADPEDVLHHVSVADVERLHAMVLTEDQAEMIKEALAQALTAAINHISATERTYVVGYQIRTGIDGSTVHESTITVSAPTATAAQRAAIDWVHDHDFYHDDRIDPRIAIISVTRSREAGTATLTEADPTWTFFGHWENDRIVVEWSQEGTLEDDRDDDGTHDEGLWAADGSGPTLEAAQAAVVAEYESARENHQIDRT